MRVGSACFQRAAFGILPDAFEFLSQAAANGAQAAAVPQKNIAPSNVVASAGSKLSWSGIACIGGATPVRLTFAPQPLIAFFSVFSARPLGRARPCSHSCRVRMEIFSFN